MFLDALINKVPKVFLLLAKKKLKETLHDVRKILFSFVGILGAEFDCWLDLRNDFQFLQCVNYEPQSHPMIIEIPPYEK